MIHGAGIDMAFVPEFRAAMDDGKTRFLETYFTSRERSYCVNHDGTRGAQSLAARYAAKEALLKALDGERLGAGPEFRFEYREAEVRNDEHGRPYLLAHGALNEYMRGRGITRTLLSLSHTGDYAIAQVVLDSGPTSF